MHVYEKSAVLLAGAVEYLAAEMLELAGNVTHDFKCKTITPRHIFLAFENDQELQELFKNVTIPGSGVVPHIHPIFLKSKIEPSEHKKKNHSQKSQKSQSSN